MLPYLPSARAQDNAAAAEIPGIVLAFQAAIVAKDGPAPEALFLPTDNHPHNS
jgi:hypothetical protein